MTREPGLSRYLRDLLPVLFALALAGAACGGAADENPAMEGADAPTTEGSRQHNDADVTFVQAMIPHHSQAIQMVQHVIDRGESAEVKDLARRIQAAQQPEIDTMSRWLRDWGVAEGGAGALEQHGGMDGTMGGGGMGGMGGHGMMSEAEMQQMMAVSGAQLDRMFLEMMIRHHQGAVATAETEIRDGRFVPAKELAQRIITTQNAEIAEMQPLLGR